LIENAVASVASVRFVRGAGFGLAPADGRYRFDVRDLDAGAGAAGRAGRRGSLGDLDFLVGLSPRQVFTRSILRAAIAASGSALI
jgi:hypothetical protein